MVSLFTREWSELDLNPAGNDFLANKAKELELQLARNENLATLMTSKMNIDRV